MDSERAGQISILLLCSYIYRTLFQNNLKSLLFWTVHKWLYNMENIIFLSRSTLSNLIWYILKPFYVVIFVAWFSHFNYLQIAGFYSTFRFRINCVPFSLLLLLPHNGSISFDQSTSKIQIKGTQFYLMAYSNIFHSFCQLSNQLILKFG